MVDDEHDLPPSIFFDVLVNSVVCCLPFLSVRTVGVTIVTIFVRHLGDDVVDGVHDLPPTIVVDVIGTSDVCFWPLLSVLTV